MKQIMKSKIKAKFEVIRLRIRFSLAGSEIGKCLMLKNEDCIRIGTNVKNKDGYRIECYKKFGGGELTPQLVLGDNVNIGYCFSALVSDSLIIEKNAIIASNVLITTHNHGTNPESAIPYARQDLCTDKVIVGEGAWIGEKVIILPGVKIGHHSIIAAGAVVTKSIPPYSMAAGVPAKVFRNYDFDLHLWSPV